MACGACKNLKRGCKDDCCFAEFFAPEDAEMFAKLKAKVPVAIMRETLSDVNATKEYKKQRVQEWKAMLNAEGKEKQAGSSSASLSNELGCKDTCLFADLFPRGAKEVIVEQGEEWVEAELKPKLERLWREIEEEQEVARIMLDFKNKWKLDVLADQIMLDSKNKGEQQ
nr:hypothetical protein CFP56_45442 [Quercus suber]